MKYALVFLVLALPAVLAALEPTKGFGEWEEPAFVSFLETKESDPAEFASMGEPTGYVPTSGIFDNINTLTDRTPTLPSSIDCTVRPQTTVEIRRMRRSAARIAQMIEYEVQVMEKRKAYIEQMTAYLNDRIRELNKVKSDLEQEKRWIDVSNERINELAAKERLIKMQDIQVCLDQQAAALTGDATQQKTMMENIKKQTDVLNTQVEAIKKNIDSINQGKDPNAA